MKLWFERGAWATRTARRTLGAVSPQSVRRIAVIRHAALGDMVLVRPFLVEARKFFPNAEIVLSLVSNYTYGAPTDLVDSVNVISGNDKNVSFMKRIREARSLGPVDILFDLADTTRSRYLALLTPAKLKVGFPYRWYLRTLLFDVAVFRSDFAFEAEVMLDTLKLLGANPTVPLDFEWPVQLRAQPGEKQPEIIVYFPFASVRSKCWPKENFSALIDRMAAEFKQHQHVILGGIGPNEDPTLFVDAVERHSNVFLKPAMSLDETIEFLMQSTLLISNDTGVRNLAIATNTPTLGIFFTTVPHRYWPRWGGLHDSVFVADGTVPSVEDVTARARALL